MQIVRIAFTDMIMYHVTLSFSFSLCLHFSLSPSLCLHFSHSLSLSVAAFKHKIITEIVITISTFSRQTRNYINCCILQKDMIILFNVVTVWAGQRIMDTHT